MMEYERAIESACAHHVWQRELTRVENLTSRDATLKKYRKNKAANRRVRQHGLI
jgi:hypothetical protein